MSRVSLEAEHLAYAQVFDVSVEISVEKSSIK